MKYIVILGDGMADLPYDGLGGKTPLEAANKPNIDNLAQQGVCGMCKTVPDGIKPGSDVANLSVMGYSPLKYYSGRSPLEALSIGVDMAEDDLAVRCNLVTLSSEDNFADRSMIDYSAGEISTEEAAQLIEAVEAALGNDIFTFYSGVSYRHCLIMHHGVRGTEYTPPHDISGKVVGDYLPKGIYGDQMLDLMVKSYDVLKEHPINLKRIEEGKNPANSIWLWGEGSRPSLPDFAKTRGLKGAVISAVDLLKGIGIAGGMDIIEVEGATGTVKTNFTGKAEACVKAIRDGYDYVYLHMEAPDECGHQGDSEGKVKSIELIDEKVVAYILKELEGEDIRILICPDHPTPLITKTHSSEPIPFVIYDSTCINEGISAYTENECKKTNLFLNSGDELVDLFLQSDEVNEMKGEQNILEDNQDIAVVEGNADLDSEQVLDDAELSSSDVEQEQIAEENQIQDVSEIEESDSQDEDVENIKENQNENATDYDDEAVQAKSGNMIIVAEGQEDEENPSKIDPNDQKEENDGGDDDNNPPKGKKGKKGDKQGKMSPKKKKIVTILIAIAVVAVVALVAILTPILVINAPKILISEAEDFIKKPVKDKKELYYLQKDVTVDGDLTLGLNVDLNKKTLTVNGVLTLEAPKGGEMTLGVKSGDQYKIGGKIKAQTLVIKNAEKVTIYTNVVSLEVEFDHVGQANVIGSLQANKRFDVKSSKVVFDELAFSDNSDTGESDWKIETMNAVNSDIEFNKAVNINLNLQNTKVRANSDIKNAILDNTSEIRLFGAVYNDMNSKELGSITGGKLVYVSGKEAFALIDSAAVVWIDRNASGIIKNPGKLNYIDFLERPQFAVIEREGSSAQLELSSVDALATKVLVTIDNAPDEGVIVFDIKNDNISKDDGFVFNLGDKLNSVGTHTIKIVLRSDEPEFIKDSDPYFTEHTHYITLDKVGGAKVVPTGDKYVLQFTAVDFAETYEVVFDGVMVVLKNDGKKGGESIEYILSEDENFKPLLAVPGNHSITIVAKSSVEGINSSEKAYAKFDAIKGNLSAPEVEVKFEGGNWVISWKNVENAARYTLVFKGTDKADYTISTNSNQVVISASELDGYESVEVTAVGGKYYNNSTAPSNPLRA